MAHALGVRPGVRTTYRTGLRAVVSPTRPLGVPHWARPTLEHVWLGLALVAAALGSGLLPIESIDYWWTVKLGDLIRQNGALLTTEPLIYTPVREVPVDGQWLARVIVSIVHEAGGVELSLALRSLVAVATAGLLLRLCRDLGAGARISAGVVCLAALLYLPGLAVRPQLFAVVPFLLVLRAALVPPTSTASRLVTIGAVVFWANVHGSFVLLYPLLGVAVLDAIRRHVGGERDRLRPALLLAGVCALAPLVNPHGPWLARYVWDTVLFNGGGTAVGTLAAEWQPPTVQTGYGRAVVLSLLGVVLLVGAGRRPRFAEGLLLVLFGLLALSAVRHIMWWSLVMAPFAARALGDLLSSLATHVAARLAERRARPRPRDADAPPTDTRDADAQPTDARDADVPPTDPRDRAAAMTRPPSTGVPLANAALLVLFALVIVACLPWHRTRLPLPAARTALVDPTTPVAVAEYLAVQPGPGELFHSTDWGGYFGWRLGPERKLFIDDRFELHPAEVWRDYMTLSRGHASWERLADRYGIGQLALDREAQAGLVEAVAESPRWMLTYEDERAVVYERRAASDRPVEALVDTANAGPAGE